MYGGAHHFLNWLTAAAAVCMAHPPIHSAEPLRPYLDDGSSLHSVIAAVSDAATVSDFVVTDMRRLIIFAVIGFMISFMSLLK